MYNITKNDNIKLYVGDILSILYGFSWAVFVCGLLINNIYYKDIANRDSIKRWYLILSDIFGHILPLYIIFYYGPKVTRINFKYLVFFVILSILLLGNYFSKIYIGCPNYIIYFLVPFITLSTFYIRYK